MLGPSLSSCTGPPLIAGSEGICTSPPARAWTWVKD